MGKYFQSLLLSLNIFLSTSYKPHLQEEQIMSTQLRFAPRFAVSCKCGNVKATITPLESAKPLRLVCYCKDCRGYFNTLNDMAVEKAKQPAAHLDEFGGVDWTAIYPRDIDITEGKDKLTTCKIRPESKIRQVYSTCCYTPMFRFGEMSVLMNTDIIKEENKEPVKFRIIGRDSLKGDPDVKAEKPNMSWSVPFSWFWVMPKRLNKGLMNPMPLEIKQEDIKVLEGFKKG